MKKLIIGALIIIAIVVLLIVNPFSSNSQPAASAVQASSAVVERGNIIISVNSTGIIEPIHTVELKSKAAVEIIEFPLEVGDRVS